MMKQEVKKKKEILLQLIADVNNDDPFAFSGYSSELQKILLVARMILRYKKDFDLNSI